MGRTAGHVVAEAQGAIAGRTVVITGAAGGLGAAVASALAARRAALLLVDIDAAGVHRQAARLGCEALGVDVSDPAGREQITSRCQELGWTPDVLISNAGVEKVSPFDALEATEVRRLLEVNLVAAMMLTHSLLPAMRRHGEGHVISMASMAGIKPVPFGAVYNATKAALVAFSASLSKELGGSGVAATVICPSAVRDVGMWARTRAGRSPNMLVDSSTVDPEDVVAAVLRALEQRPPRVLVASPLVRAGALLSAMSPWVDRATDRLSGIDRIYRQRIETDRRNRL